MRKGWALVALVMVLVLSLAACGGSAVKLSKDPQLRKAQQIVQACLTKSTLLTKGGRQAFYTCVAPKKRKAQTEACIQKALSHGSYLTKHERAAVEQKVATCVVSR